ncbi:MAG: monovalent cation/H+ antiporter subunit A [Rudaea sp.]
MAPSLAAIVSLPLIAAYLPVAAARKGRVFAAWTAAAVLASPLAIAAALGPHVLAGNVPEARWMWLPGAGLDLSLRLDGLALLFVVLILGIGLLIVLYAAYYLAEDDAIGRFFAYVLLFAGAMLGVVLADNALLLVVFWELTSLSSFLLIGFWNDRSDARRGARMALAITGAGGLCLLAGVLLAGHVAGTYELSQIVRRGAAIRESPLYVPILTLVLLGAFTKSAQVPFHFWLPQAMAAPTPVSAYLHSATMVKAGVFLLARFYPALSGTDAWFYTVTTVGAVTLVFAAGTALFQHDLKGLLAYSTISHLGLITLLFGLDTPLSAVAAVFHIINHALFKASLFMAAGIIDHETGSRDMRKLNGLWKYMPYTATLAMVAASSMAGVPLLNGFLSKEMFFSEALLLERGGWMEVAIPLAAGIGGMLGIAYSVRFAHDVFFNGEPVGLPRTPHEPPRWMKVPVEVLVAMCLLVGVAPVYTVRPLLDVAARATLGDGLPAYSLAIWHGFSLPLLMSMLATVGGIAIYFSLQRFYRLHEHVHSPLTAASAYDALLDGTIRFAAIVTRAVENGSLQRYVAWVVAAALALGVAPFVASGYAPGPTTTAATPVAVVGLLLLFAASAGTVVLHRERLAALVMSGVVGLVCVLFFAYFAAPDLALTQVAVEAVTIMLLLLALHYLPQRTPAESSVSRKLRDAALAVAAGGGVAALVYAVLTRPFESISDFYLENSVSQAGGRNVVNVILVDFRGFDTFGEIIVLAIAALGIHAVLAGFAGAGRDDDRAWAADRHPLMLRVLTSVLLPLMLLVSIYIFLRGHDRPGGGFIAGLVTGIALILLYAAHGVAWTASRLRVDYQRTIGIGVLVAGATGIASWWFGQPFLTSAFGHPHLPLLGEVPLASAMAFDLGVYLTVVGVVMLVLARLGELSAAPAANASAP